MTHRFLSFALGTVLSLLLGLASPGAAAAGSQTEFKYDAVGNLRYLSTPSGATYYDYDVLDRLTDETGPAKTQHITYDGNRLSDGGGALTYPGGQAPSNRLATRYGAQYTY